MGAPPWVNRPTRIPSPVRAKNLLSVLTLVVLINAGSIPQIVLRTRSRRGPTKRGNESKIRLCSWLFRPFRARGLFRRLTQGGALGYRLSGFQPFSMASRKFVQFASAIRHLTLNSSPRSRRRGRIVCVLCVPLRQLNPCPFRLHLISAGQAVAKICSESTSASSQPVCPSRSRKVRGVLLSCPRSCCG